LIEKGIIEDSEKVQKIVSLVRERANFVNELWAQASFFFEAPQQYDEKTVQKRWKPETPTQLTKLSELLATIEDFSPENTEVIIKEWITANEYNLGGIMNAFRLALVGEPKGPHIFDIIDIIGKEETIARIKKAVEVI
jgi:glutamyl-tRNA synthetase